MRVISALCVLLLVNTGWGLIHNLHIEKDRRTGFIIENFGFDLGGRLELSLSNLQMFGAESEATRDNYQVGFVVRRTNTDSSEFLSENSPDNCLLTAKKDETDFWVIGLPTIVEQQQKDWSLDITKDGLYNVYFINCEQVSDGNGKKETPTIKFDLKLTMYNKGIFGPDFLSVSDSKLTNVYYAFFGVYMVMAAVWIATMRKTSTLVFKIHYLMLAMVFTKSFSLLASALRFHFMSVTGVGSGWDIVFYIFAFLKGIMMFVVIGLIGTGWAFVKPFLSDKDKKIFLVVIPLQVLANIALVVVDETAPGSQDWVTWYDILRLVDIICCGAVLFPIVWSIKHLREASSTDGKTARNMEKLKLFRQFYIMVVAWIYFTRIIVYLLDATVPFRYVWLSQFCSELSTVAFYVITGYKFRPVDNNPYLAVAPDDGDAIEMGTAINDGEREEHDLVGPNKGPKGAPGTPPAARVAE